MTISEKIDSLATKYASQLKSQMDGREHEMKVDDTSHYLIYRVLGVTTEEGRLIDLYQNKGRFLYKYAGSFLEEAAKLCFRDAFPSSGSVRIKNTEGKNPKQFEIDCLIENHDALEIKWRDATTDGDHITKEHTRIRTIVAAGYKPIRVMFYYPNRTQAIKVQRTLETLYAGVAGEYHCGESAWIYLQKRSGVDLKGILERIAAHRAMDN